MEKLNLYTAQETYEEGWEAAKLGIPKENNPYEEYSKRAKMWNNGYNKSLAWIESVNK